jgi:hypothetical protein
MYWGLVALVEEQVVYVADLLIMLIVDCVACVPIFYFRELVSVCFAFQGKNLHLGCFVPTCY